eukprot:gnl/Hemi2/13145_TR4494_c0_g1_i1.p1 gnl/Hemi2/13145_TR4494_c0_g1~~gnl/Hemi2/13145_TR4494_c0_g1_i1.p1  ORF type:complete len:430 (-),score=144.40 gnl/Hemi2/13145_TR4494_c0_g1_i1:114-1403(-)
MSRNTNNSINMGSLTSDPEYAKLGEDAPTDRYYMVYVIFFFLGMTIMLPWNTIITAFDFFTIIFGKTDFEFYFSIIFNIPCFAFSMLLTFFGRRIPVWPRILGSMVIFLIVLVVLPFLGFAVDHGHLSAHTAIIIIYTCVALTGLCVGVIYSTATGVAALFPGPYMGCLNSGVGLGGVIVGLIRIFTKVALPQTDAGTLTGSLVYFIIAATVVFVSILGYLALPYISFARFYISQSNVHVEPDYEGGQDMSSHTYASIPAKPKSSEIFGKIYMLAGSLGLNFFLTLSLFPGVTGMIQSTNPSLNDSQWFQIIMISMFLLFDWIGRSLPPIKLIFTAQNIWIPALVRVLFFPLFILSVKPHLIDSDIAACIMMAVFATSNGYLCTALFMLAPSVVEDHEREQAGVIMVVCLNTGITSGCFFSLLVNLLVS